MVDRGDGHAEVRAKILRPDLARIDGEAGAIETGVGEAVAEKEKAVELRRCFALHHPQTCGQCGREQCFLLIPRMIDLLLGIALMTSLGTALYVKTRPAPRAQAGGAACADRARAMASANRGVQRASSLAGDQREPLAIDDLDAIALA